MSTVCQLASGRLSSTYHIFIIKSSCPWIDDGGGCVTIQKATQSQLAQPLNFPSTLCCRDPCTKDSLGSP
eukprot:3719476-Amphidinium_carterae.1